MSKGTLLRYLTPYPDLRKLADDEVELVLDLCEESLFHDAIHGDADARRLVLLTRGRSRGHVIRRETTGTHGQPLNPPEQNNAVIIVGGSKQEYLEGLRQMRGAEREARRETRATARRQTRQ